MTSIRRFRNTQKVTRQVYITSSRPHLYQFITFQANHVTTVFPTRLTQPLLYEPKYNRYQLYLPDLYGSGNVISRTVRVYQTPLTRFCYHMKCSLSKTRERISAREPSCPTAWKKDGNVSPQKYERASQGAIDALMLLRVACDTSKGAPMASTCTVCTGIISCNSYQSYTTTWDNNSARNTTKHITNMAPISTLTKSRWLSMMMPLIDWQRWDETHWGSKCHNHVWTFQSRDRPAEERCYLAVCAATTFTSRLHHRLW